MDQISENMDYQQVGADYASVPAKQNINLKPPKRTLSAYACYSRKVYVPPGFPHFLRFNSVRERLGAHRKQCEIFREIADMWRKLPESEKVPFIEEVEMCGRRSRAGEGGPGAEENGRAELQPRAAVRGEGAGIQRGVRAGGRAGAALAAGDLRGEGHGAAGAVFARNESARLEGNHRSDPGNHPGAVHGERVRRGPRSVLCRFCTRKTTPAWTASTHPSPTCTRARRGGSQRAEMTRSAHKFQCPHCKKQFNWKSNLNVHLRTHDKSRQREFKCTVVGCKKAFFDNQHLKQHMQTHNRNRQVVPRLSCDPRCIVVPSWGATRSTPRAAD